jgi:hypothetical protein
MIIDLLFAIALVLFLDWIMLNQMLVVIPYVWDVSEHWKYTDTIGLRHVLVLGSAIGFFVGRYRGDDDVRLFVVFAVVFLVGHSLAYLKLARAGRIGKYEPPSSSTDVD